MYYYLIKFFLLMIIVSLHSFCISYVAIKLYLKTYNKLKPQRRKKNDL